ncbi:hypothetical protein P8631_10965 [Guyparkeria sp. 1SP6A2]|nr:hypothetical protein [Guyparkeria sp. 1SP6A2]
MAKAVVIDVGLKDSPHILQWRLDHLIPGWASFILRLTVKRHSLVFISRLHGNGLAVPLCDVGLKRDARVIPGAAGTGATLGTTKASCC